MRLPPRPALPLKDLEVRGTAQDGGADGDVPDVKMQVVFVAILTFLITPACIPGLHGPDTIAQSVAETAWMQKWKRGRIKGFFWASNPGMVVKMELLERWIPTSLRPPKVAAGRVLLRRAARPVSKIQRRSAGVNDDTLDADEVVWIADAGLEGWNQFASFRR
jgi:hypothetical protein